MYSEPISADRAARHHLTSLDTLNLVSFSAPQIETGLTLISRVPGAGESHPTGQNRALLAYVRGAGFDEVDLACEALGVRLNALARWIAQHDPQRQSHAGSVVEAAAVSKLSQLGDEVGFEPAFQELILFIEGIPW